MLSQRLASAIAQRKAADGYRELEARLGPQGREALVDGQRLLNFCSNDYLGLANHPRVVEALTSGAKRYGAGSGASQLVSGRSDCHTELEAAIATWLGFEDCLVFSSGYQANLAMLGTLIARHDQIFQDRDNHASLIDAALHTRADYHRYRHTDTRHLSTLLDQHPANYQQLQWMVTDGVFSMDGEIAPLSELASLNQATHRGLLVDDAHGVGVLGKHGCGSLAHCGVAPAEVSAMMLTFGKALGTFGAAIVASREVIDALRQFARPYIYTTALPPALVVATQQSLSLLQAEPERQQRLQRRIQQFQYEATAAGLEVLPSDTAIQGVIIGDNHAAMAAAEQLRARDIWLKAMRPPTVAKGTARLRITLSAEHTESDISQLIEALTDV